MTFSFLNLNGINSEIFGNKLDQRETQKLIQQTDIVGFAETMNSEKLNIYVQGFESYSFPGTKFQKKGRASGGFFISIRNGLATKVQFIKALNEYCVWLKIQMDRGQYLILGFVYIPPADSKIHQYLEKPIFETINEEIDRIRTLGPMLIFGDWNARVGNLKDDMYLDDCTTDWEYELERRTNIDKEMNKFGLELIQLCYEQNMKLCNGR